MLRITVDGATGVIQSIESTGRESNKIVADAFRAGTNLIKQGIQFAIPQAKTPGHDIQRIRDAIGSKVKTNRKDGDLVYAKVGVNVGKKNPRQRVKKGESRTGFIARRSSMQARMPKQMAYPVATWLIGGTQDRWTGWKSIRTKNGRKTTRTKNPVRFRGRVIGYPAVEAGMVTTQAAAMDLIQKKINDGVQKLFRRVP